jgi:hypothetical protein
MGHPRLLGWAGGPVGLLYLQLGARSSWVLGAFGFGVMLISAIVFTQNLRKMGRVGWQQMMTQIRGANLGDVAQGASKRMRDRFKRGE